MKRKTFLMVMLTLALFMALVPPAHVRAASYTVSNTDDSGAGSLRAAILQANATPRAIASKLRRGRMNGSIGDHIG